MLHRLAIRDFVIVDALEIEFAPGLTVLTGETGAGKSILVDALQLALGARGDAGVVREGCRAGRGRAPSSTPRPALAAWLAEAGFEATASDDAAPARAPHDRRPGQEPRLDQRQRGDDRPAARGRRAPGRHPRPARLAEPDPRRRPCAALLDAYAGIDAAPLAAHWAAWRAAAQALADAGSPPGRPRARARAARLADRRDRPARRPATTNGPSSTPSTSASPTRSR